MHRADTGHRHVTFVFETEQVFIERERGRTIFDDDAQIDCCFGECYCHVRPLYR
ncbi:MAG: hypothetical protein NT024_06895 [Proteobacteria bacterium]|nr:hypothetical protein [Pseudomonadota bacterium]